MELWLAVLIAVVAVGAVDWGFRNHFRQEGDRTLGARQRGPQSGWKRPTGEVIDEMTEGDEPDEQSGS